MAIYVLLQCCKCNEQKRIHLYCCSINKNDIYYYLCEHFSIRYTYICNFGFFIKWSIVLNVKAICNNCNRSLYLGENTFNSRYYSLETHATCCHHVFRVNVSGSSYATHHYGIQLQNSEDNKAKEEEKKKLQRQEQLKVQQIMNEQNEEENRLMQENNIDVDFIYNEITNINNAFIYDMNNELNFNIGEHIQKKNAVLKFCKFEIH